MKSKLDMIMEFGFQKIDQAVGHAIWVRSTPKELGFVDIEAMILGPRPYNTYIPEWDEFLEEINRD